MEDAINASSVLDDVVDAAQLIADLLAATPGQEQHKACGVTAKPCRDCVLTSPLPCTDPGSCGRTMLCRPCAATWRCRIWREHLLFVRAFHAAVARYPSLARLHANQETAAALFWELRRAVRRDVWKWLERSRAKSAKKKRRGH